MHNLGLPVFHVPPQTDQVEAYIAQCTDRCCLTVTVVHECGRVGGRQGRLGKVWSAAVPFESEVSGKTWYRKGCSYCWAASFSAIGYVCFNSPFRVAHATMSRPRLCNGADGMVMWGRGNYSLLQVIFDQLLKTTGSA